MYFENMIPTEAPDYIVPENKERFTALFRRVASRMERLEDALVMSGLRGEVFAKAVMPLMATMNGVPQLDNMSSEEITSAAMVMAKGIDESTIEDRIAWNCLTVVDTAFVTTPEWEAIRCLGVGGSDAACIENIGYRSAAEVYYDKRGRRTEDTLSVKTQFIFDYGHKLEPLVIDHFCRLSGAVPTEETRMFAHKDYPFITANIDKLLRLPDGRLCVFEAKTTTGFNWAAWTGDNIPPQYMAQCRQYPAVLDDDRIFGTYIGCIYGNTPDQFKCKLVERDKVLEQDQLQRLSDFWNNNVLAGEEPPMSYVAKGTDANQIPDLRLAMSIAGKCDKSIPPVALDFAELGETISAYIETKKVRDVVKEKFDSLDEEAKILSSGIIRALGAAEKGVCECPPELAPNGKPGYDIVAYNKPRSKTTVDREQLQLAFPDAYNACVTVDPDSSRVFSLKIEKRKGA